MSIANITPRSSGQLGILPATGNVDEVTYPDGVPFNVYLNEPEFISGAVDQVGYTYKMLGGNKLAIELDTSNIYTAYQKATLEYSRIINMHQAKNVLSNLLGFETGTFDHNGELKSGLLSSSLSGANIALSFPSFTFSYAKKVTDGFANKAGVGGTIPIYSASINVTPGVQDYDLQAVISSSANASGSNELYRDIVLNNPGKRIKVHRVFYESPSNQWRFYGYYGGLSVVGNLSTYGQYSDDSTFEIVPAWQNKLQALAYETNLYTRASHYSYEIKANRIRLFPVPTVGSPSKIWFDFSVETNPWEEASDNKSGTKGVNNVNTLPFANIPFCNINSMGKDWIRDYALAITKGVLAQVRGKLSELPIPNSAVTLNYSQLWEQSVSEMESMRQQLKEDLDALVYNALVKADAETAESAVSLEQKSPTLIYVG